MTYSVRFSNQNKNPIVVADTIVNQSTSINLVGKNSSNYGQLFAENFLHLLENAANLTPPSSPVEGQLWYDTSAPASKILKVYDGANWVPANGVHQSSSSPLSKKIGDIWVDTGTGQLNIWSGSEWLLIGPTLSGGLKNGVYPTKILDNLGDAAAYHNVILSYINDDVITIVAKESFTPNPLISGFTSLVPGLNVSTKKFNDATARLGGLANTALSLQVSNSVDPISADYFLRNDTSGSIDGFLNLNSNSGIRIGSISQTVYLEKNINDAILSNRYDSGNIHLAVLKNNSLNRILTVDGNHKRIGINTITPLVELDVEGSAKISGTLEVTSAIYFANTTDATALGTAGFITLGGASIAKKVIIGNDTTINGQLLLSRQDSSSAPIAGPAVMPTLSNTYDIGSVDTPFRKVYANEFITTSTSFSMVPTGSVTLFSGAVPPDGWLVCDGSSIDTASYPRLYGVISSAYGSVSAGYFNIPLLTTLPATNPNVTISLNYIIKY
jgi:hypothetical protein